MNKKNGYSEGPGCAADFDLPVTGYSGGLIMKMELSAGMITCSVLLMIVEPAGLFYVDCFKWREDWPESHPVYITGRIHEFRQMFSDG